MFSRHYWEGIKDNFTVEETIVLAKALIRFEERFEWPRSCEAASICILKDLWDREPKTAELLADWIACRTKMGTSALLAIISQTSGCWWEISAKTAAQSCRAVQYRSPSWLA